MEQSKTKEQSNNENNPLVVDSEIRDYLTETRKWTMFFAVLGFIGIGLMALAALGMVLFGTLGSGYFNNREAAILGGLTLVYVAVGVIYFFPVLYLLKFSRNMKLAIEQSEQSKLIMAFEYLKSHFKIVGILTIVIFGLYFLIGMIAAIAGVFSML